MRTFKRVSAGIASATLTLSSLMTLGLTGVAHAATLDTWTGGGSDNKFSTAANWSAGVPTAGTNLAFNNTTQSSGLLLTDDLASSVTFGSVTFTGTYGVTIVADNPLTLTGDVTSSVPLITDDIAVMFEGEITLGADVTVSNVILTSNSSPVSGDGETLHLNGHTLLFKDSQNSLTTAINNNISGAGTLSVDVGATALYLDGINSYSGTTNIISSGDINTTSGANSSGLFGTSSIVVSSDATLSLNAFSNYTFTNPITFQQASSNANVFGNQLMVWARATGVSVAIPNITLEGNTRFSTNDTEGTVVVNLAGITANGHCVQYGDETNFDASHWQNGPTACVVSATSTPKTPDTGFSLVTAHPVVTLAATLITGATVLGLGRTATRRSSAARNK